MIELHIREIYSPQEIANTVLRERRDAVALSDLTRCYVTIGDKGNEASFVAIDRWGKLGILVLYELYVAPEFRRQGVGSTTLQIVEQIASEEGFLAIRVRPHPMEQTMSPQDLKAWYRSRGYVEIAGVHGEHEKRFGT